MKADLKNKLKNFVRFCTHNGGGGVSWSSIATNNTLNYITTYIDIHTTYTFFRKLKIKFDSKIKKKRNYNRKYSKYEYI